MNARQLHAQGRERRRLCTRRSPWRVGLALWVGCVALVALAATGFGRTLHFALVPHERCEHGKLVHPRRHGQAHQAAVATVAAARALAWLQGHGVADGHDHCDVKAVPPADVPQLGVGAPVAVLSWVLAPATTPRLAERRPIALLSLAPKSSPPRL